MIYVSSWLRVNCDKLGTYAVLKASVKHIREVIGVGVAVGHMEGERGGGGVGMPPEHSSPAKRLKKNKIRYLRYN